MAVEDKYVNTNFVGANALVQRLGAGVLLPASQSKGAKTLTMVQTFEVAAADDDGSIYRIFRGLSSSLKPVELTFMCDAITTMTDADAGFYPTDGGPVTGGDKDILMDGQTFASASKVLDGLKDVPIEYRGVRTIAELLGHSVESKTDKLFYDLCLTANVATSVAGTITAKLVCISED